MLSQPASITCRELIEFLGDYLEGELPEAARQAFDQHLSLCPSCVAYLEGYKQTVTLGKMSLKPSDESAVGKVPDSLLRAIQAARGKQE